RRCLGGEGRAFGPAAAVHARPGGGAAGAAGSGLFPGAARARGEERAGARRRAGDALGKLGHPQGQGRAHRADRRDGARHGCIPLRQGLLRSLAGGAGTEAAHPRADRRGRGAGRDAGGRPGAAGAGERRASARHRRLPGPAGRGRRRGVVALPRHHPRPGGRHARLGRLLRPAWPQDAGPVRAARHARALPAAGARQCRRSGRRDRRRRRGRGPRAGRAFGRYASDLAHESIRLTFTGKLEALETAVREARTQATEQQKQAQARIATLEATVAKRDAQLASERAAWESKLASERADRDGKLAVLRRELTQVRSKAEQDVWAEREHWTSLLSYRAGDVLVNSLARPWTLPLLPFRLFGAWRGYRADRAARAAALP